MHFNEQSRPEQALVHRVCDCRQQPEIGAGTGKGAVTGAGAGTGIQEEDREQEYGPQISPVEHLRQICMLIVFIIFVFFKIFIE